MKKIMVLVLLAMVLALPAGAEETLTFADINAEDAFVIETEHLADYRGEIGTDLEWFRQMQGSCTDGEFAYLMVLNAKKGGSSIWKVDLKDYSVVDRRFNVAIDHGNDAIYNPSLDQLIVSNCGPNYKKISYVDPKTLEIVDTRELDRDIYCISYHPDRDQYVLGYTVGFFAITDGDFKRQGIYRMESTGWVTQGSDCDDNFIYFPQWDSETMQNYLLVYDWNGKHVNTIEVKTDVKLEIESLFHVGEDVYLCFNVGGSHMYKAQLKKAP